MNDFDDERPVERRASARVSGKRNRASGSVVYPEFHTTNTSSPITGIQWNRRLKSTRSLSLSYCTNASRLVRALKSYSNRLADNTAVNAPTRSSAFVRVQIGAHDDVATTAPRRRKLEIGAVTAIELSPIHERPTLRGRPGFMKYCSS